MPLFTNVYKSQVVQDFFHQQYLLPLVYMKTCTKIPLPLPCHVFLTFQAVRKWVILIIIFFSQSGTNRWEVQSIDCNLRAINLLIVYKYMFGLPHTQQQSQMKVFSSGFPIQQNGIILVVTVPGWVLVPRYIYPSHPIPIASTNQSMNRPSKHG